MLCIGCLGELLFQTRQDIRHKKSRSISAYSGRELTVSCARNIHAAPGQEATVSILAKSLVLTSPFWICSNFRTLGRHMLGFSSIVGYYRCPSIPEAPAWLHGLEIVINIYIRKVMSNIWVKYQFRVNFPFSCLTFFFSTSACLWT